MLQHPPPTHPPPVRDGKSEVSVGRGLMRICEAWPTSLFMYWKMSQRLSQWRSVAGGLVGVGVDPVLVSISCGGHGLNNEELSQISVTWGSRNRRKTCCSIKTLMSRNRRNMQTFTTWTRRIIAEPPDHSAETWRSFSADMLFVAWQHGVGVTVFWWYHHHTTPPRL